jgi:hypothetical protein
MEPQAAAVHPVLLSCCEAAAVVLPRQEVAETLADTRAAVALVQRELPLSPPRVVCRLSVAAAGLGAPHVAVQLLPDRYCEVMTAAVQVGALQLW